MLDGQLKKQIAEKWENWALEGMAIVLVTHDVELAANVADDVLLLENGKVVTFLSSHYPDILGEFQKIIEATSLST